MTILMPWKQPLPDEINFCLSELESVIQFGHDLYGVKFGKLIAVNDDNEPKDILLEGENKKLYLISLCDKKASDASPQSVPVFVVFDNSIEWEEYVRQEHALWQSTQA